MNIALIHQILLNHFRSHWITWNHSCKAPFESPAKMSILFITFSWITLDLTKSLESLRITPVEPLNSFEFEFSSCITSNWMTLCLFSLWMAQCNITLYIVVFNLDKKKKLNYFERFWMNLDRFKSHPITLWNYAMKFRLTETLWQCVNIQ